MLYFAKARNLIVGFAFLGSTLAQGQDYYVVIGSFADQQAAYRFAGYARNLRYDAEYIRNEVNKLYYVYVLKTQDRKLASEMTFRLQKETEFYDAWMYSGTQTRPAEVTISREAELVPPEKAEVEKPDVLVDDEVVPVVEVAPKVSFEGPTKPVAKGKFFRFQVSTPDGKAIAGRVYNVDRLQGRDLAAYATNETVDVLRPSVPDIPVTIVCEIFGYAEAVRIIDFADPSTAEGAVQDEHGVWVIPFTLERLKKGNISVMYNVSFYKDATIMLPRSKPELDELANMMKMNPAYKIKIHGHNNGNEKGIRILSMGSERNYFSMSRTTARTGSAKDLSKRRAETVKSYLVDQGIDAKRIDTYAWGGTAMLVSPGTAAATRLNNRIEIEILAD